MRSHTVPCRPADGPRSEGPAPRAVAPREYPAGPLPARRSGTPFVESFNQKPVV
ncbi:hypothetical protein [Streptomyces anulatus]|uniref:hypothetical protein n=1 Tax=Streptomyces anulatus TaxID=1892 RepID=UPI003F4A7C0B